MAHENLLLEKTKPEPGLWDRFKDYVLGPVPAPLGQTPYQSDAGRGNEPLGNFDPSAWLLALQENRDTPDEEPYLDYFTGKRPWLFSKGNLGDWQSILRNGKKLDLEQLLAQRALVRRHPTQAELALLVRQLQLIRRNTMARLGFNPEQTILLEGENNTNTGGVYYPNLDMKFIPVDTRFDANALGHESMHAGYARLRKEFPNVRQYRRDEERAVRMQMYAFSGDSEKAWRPQTFTDWLHKALLSVNDRNAQSWGQSIRKDNDAAGTLYRNLQEQIRLMNSWETPRR